LDDRREAFGVELLQALPVVPSAGQRATHGPGQEQDQADDSHDDADRPEDRDLEDQTQDEKDDAEDDHEDLQTSRTGTATAYVPP
jgi:hypothetical protein